jgi:hypothetical protein
MLPSYGIICRKKRREKSSSPALPLFWDVRPAHRAALTATQQQRLISFLTRASRETRSSTGPTVGRRRGLAA